MTKYERKWRFHETCWTKMNQASTRNKFSSKSMKLLRTLIFFVLLPDLPLFALVSWFSLVEWFCDKKRTVPMENINFWLKKVQLWFGFEGKYFSLFNIKFTKFHSSQFLWWIKLTLLYFEPVIRTKPLIILSFLAVEWFVLKTWLKNLVCFYRSHDQSF